MDDKHRKLIYENIDGLIQRTNFEQLSHACVITGLLSPVMLQNVNRIEFSDTGEPMTDEQIRIERHKKLFIKITKRGPEAFLKLRRILSDLKYDGALGLLMGNDPYISIHSQKEQAAPVTPPDENDPNDNNVTHIDDRRCSVNNDVDIRDTPYVERDRRRSSTKSINVETTLKEYTGEIRPKEPFEVKKSRRIIKHPSLETYPMQSKENRGVFFMVNMIDFLLEKDRRDGAEEDAHSLLHLFKELGFKLFSYTNLSHDVFFKILNELIQSDYAKNADCFVMALMTHGNMEEDVQRITFSDGSVVKVKDIEKCFHHHVCKNLVNKPKIFIFPFCRGDMSERGVFNTKVQTDSITFNYKINNIPILSDLIVCYATSEGFKAHRDPEYGSWYIQSFVKYMAQNAHDTSFEDIIKKIQHELSKLRTDEGQLQTANYVNRGFNKALYFNPGCSLD
ncbi:death regulator Nedd2-like caspase [Haematobia irritans]|uniref:death regulator Nedd2-like caspase n=1 Tax=Haematobia irritans TaxID=7368 RepID=UPI003F508DB2